MPYFRGFHAIHFWNPWSILINPWYFLFLGSEILLKTASACCDMLYMIIVIIKLICNKKLWGTFYTLLWLDGYCVPNKVTPQRCLVLAYPLFPPASNFAANHKYVSILLDKCYKAAKPFVARIWPDIRHNWVLLPSWKSFGHEQPLQMFFVLLAKNRRTIMNTSKNWISS